MKQYSLLDSIHAPADVRALQEEELPKLCQEVRNFLIDSVSRTGGHLASNLGVVELTVALHRVFSLPDDKIVFDVGHQSYTHKLLTGRKDGFARLRKIGGISGFPRPAESRMTRSLRGTPPIRFQRRLVLRKLLCCKRVRIIPLP